MFWEYIISLINETRDHRLPVTILSWTLPLISSTFHYLWRWRGADTYAREFAQKHNFLGKNIELLGISGGGKTQFLNSLGAKELAPRIESHIELYNSFYLSINNEYTFFQ